MSGQEITKAQEMAANWKAKTPEPKAPDSKEKPKKKGWFGK